jgi:hypothetical protein
MCPSLEGNPQKVRSDNSGCSARARLFATFLECSGKFEVEIGNSSKVPSDVIGVCKNAVICRISTAYSNRLPLNSQFI